MPRIRLAIVTVATCALAAIIGLYAARHDGDPASGTAHAGAVRPPSLPPVRFALRDQDGERVTAAGLRGRPAVITFQYTTCEDTCPVTTAQIRDALDQLGRDVPVVAISVDPPRDTAARARRYLLEQRMTGRMRFLLGDRDELAPVWRAFGIRPQGAGFEHTASTVVVDARGRQRIGFMAEHLTPEGLARDLKALGAQMP
jgi:protein SCO1